VRWAVSGAVGLGRSTPSPDTASSGGPQETTSQQHATPTDSTASSWTPERGMAVFRPPPIGPNPLINQAGLDFIKKWEGFDAEMYLDDARPPRITIGWGHLVRGNEWQQYWDTEAGRSRIVSDEEGTRLLRADVSKADAYIQRNVHVALTQEQVNAIGSFVYNVGPAPKMIKLINKGNFEAAQFEFDVVTGGGGRVLPGLVRRRFEEADMFMGR
jgi:lysozyme